MDPTLLRDTDLFDTLTDAELRTCVQGEQVRLAKGEHLFREGEQAEHFFVVLGGTLQVYRTLHGQDVPVSTFEAGMFGGEVPLLSGTPHQASGRAATDVRLFVMDDEAFWALMQSCGSVRDKILANMAVRMRELQTLSFQREKLVSLGTLAAGLAHELNNPAAAARRAAQGLAVGLDAFGAQAAALLAPVLFAEAPEGDPFAALFAQADAAEALGPVERSAREDDLGDWLDDLGLETPWELAATLVAAGFTQARLEDFAEALRPAQVPGFVAWLARDAELRHLAHELDASTQRMSDLIGAMKRYSYMDRADERVATDLHEGLDTTLVILEHKLRAHAVTVDKDYAPDLPLVAARGGALNQVWTNLLDNAIDAVPDDGTGRIRIRTYASEALPTQVSVEVTDNGTGIPEDVQARIFEPFFTTKDVGRGTGLGLDIAHKIVVTQHGGTLTVDSEPGRTTFRVCLPLGADAPSSSAQTHA